VDERSGADPTVLNVMLLMLLGKLTYLPLPTSKIIRNVTLGEFTVKSVVRHSSKVAKKKPPLIEEGRRTILSTGLIDSIKDRKRLIGCNIYVTTGGDEQHIPLLNDLVQRTQKNFEEKSSKKYVRNLSPKSLDEITEIEMETSLIEDDESERYDLGVLVHVYTDPVYNRTSFHLAGTAEIILDVAIDLIQQSVIELRKLQDSLDPSIHVLAHPHIGLVDHVAVVPLITGEEARILDANTMFVPHFILTHAANVARKIGKAMRDTLNIHIFFYGLAQPKKISLFKVRQRRTNFFKTNGKITTGSMEPNIPTTESCTVGAPDEFVENYNVRLKDTCSKKTAQYLSRLVREKDGGLEGVEALAFAYSNNRWEVACNILRPYAGGANVEQLKEVFRDWNVKKDIMEKGYRVGTTQEQSIKVIEYVSRSATHRQTHDENVMKNFQTYFQEEN
jgi:glutamate formiminotransferase